MKKAESSVRPESIINMGRGIYHLVFNVREAIKKEEDGAMPIYEYDYIEHRGSQPDTLQVLKDHLLEQVETYYNSDDINLVSVGGVDIYLDPDTRFKLRERLDAAADAGIKSVNITISGHTFNLKVIEAEEMLRAIVLQYANAYDTKSAHCKAIKESDSVDSLLPYDVTANYPRKLIL